MAPSPRLRGEGGGEGQPQTPTSACAPAPHPNPLPAIAGRGDPVGLGARVAMTSLAHQAAQIDTVALAKYLEACLPGFRGPIEAEKTPTGQSNPTFILA